MNIQIISQYYYPDNFRINDIAAELSTCGHRVNVLTGLPDYATSTVPEEYRHNHRRKEVIKGVHIQRVRIIARRRGVFFRIMNYLSFVISASLYALLCPKPNCDVIYVNQTSPVFQAIPALIYKMRSNKKLVLYCYDLWPESIKAWGIKEKSIVFKAVRAISSWVYRKCDSIAITSRPFRQYLSEKCGVDNRRIIYLPQYVEDFCEDIIGLYEENDCIDFLFAGNIGSVQNIDCILRAVAEVKTDECFCVHIVGDGSELPALKNLAEKIDIGKKVIFHGRHPVEMMRNFYQMADCFLLTLRGGDWIGATLPGKVQGYLCVGKPILAAIDGAGKELIEQADCGACVGAGDHIALAKKMTSVIENFETYRCKGENGRLFYEKNYRKQFFMDQLMKIFMRNS